MASCVYWFPWIRSFGPWFFVGTKKSDLESDRTFMKLNKAESGYASGFVLRRPITRSPSFHCPRFSRSSTRSKRLRTLRFTAVLEEDL